MSKLNVNAISPQSGSTIRLTSNLNINGHVTASGNISASGTVFADNFQSTGGDSAGISFTDDFVLTGNMTASGDISGSSTSLGSFGNVFAATHITASGNISGSATSTGSFGVLELNTAGNLRGVVSFTHGNLSNTVIGYAGTGKNLDPSGGRQNTLIGYTVGSQITTGDQNVAIGQENLSGGNSTGNTAVGYRALKGVTTGVGNVGIGRNAADALQSGNFNIGIGQGADLGSTTAANRIVIGHDAAATADNQTVIGNTSQTHVVFGGDALISGSAQSTGSFGRIESSGDMGIDGNIDVKGNVTAQNFIVSSSVTNITYQSLSGSTIFGDTSDDLHRFTGSIRQTSTSTGSFGRVEVPKQTGGGPITLGGGAYQDVIIGDGTGTSDIVLDGNSEATLRYKVGGNEKWFLMARSSNNFIFRRNSADRITIDTNGNLAIGFNLVPTERLHVGGNIFATGNISGSSTSTGSFGAVTIDGSPNIHGSNTGANYTGGNTGGWGFGTTEIDGAGITLSPDGTKSSTALVNNSGLGITHTGANGSYSALQINTGAGKVLWVGNDAKIGIKNSDPVTELDVRGTISGSNIEAATKITTLGKVAIGTATLPYNGLLVSDPGGASSTSLGNVSGVGITTSGTNTSYYALQVNTGTGALLRVNNGGIVDFPSATKISGSSTSTGSFGAIQSAGNITPKVDDSVDLGAADKRFKNIFTTDLQLSNEGKDKGNEVDGTTGSWTIQEGEEELYLLNRKNGKKYKFMLQEIK